MSRRHHGSTLDDFLKGEGLFEETQTLAIKEVVVWQLTEAMNGLLALARDYAQMRAMFIAAPPEFEVMMARLAEAERTLNASGAS